MTIDYRYCTCEQPLEKHVFGRGYICGICDMPIGNALPYDKTDEYDWRKSSGDPEQNRAAQNLRYKDDHSHPDLGRGDFVVKTGGDYTFEGWVLCITQKRSGAWRVIVENPDGVVHIFNPSQLMVTFKEKRK